VTAKVLKDKAKNSFAIVNATSADIEAVDSSAELKEEEKKDNSYVNVSEPELDKSLMDFKDQKLNLRILMKIDLRNQDHLEYVIKEMKLHRS
jgi:hypothetical protein